MGEQNGSSRPVALTIRAKSRGPYSGYDVYLGEAKIGYRPFDGGGHDEVISEVEGALVEMLRDNLGWDIDAEEWE